MASKIDGTVLCLESTGGGLRIGRTRHRCAHWKATPPDLASVTTLDGRRRLVLRRLVNAHRRAVW